MSTRSAAVLFILVLALAALAPRTTTHAQGPLPTLRSAHGAVAAVIAEPALDSVEPRAGGALEPMAAEPVDIESTEAPRDPLAADMANGRWTRGFIRHRIVHFTFDDGPRPSTTRRLLDQLDRYGIKATFFIVGRQLDGRRHAEERALLQEMAERGHTLGSHTFDHARLTSLSDEEIEAEIDRTEAGFRQVFGERPWLFRPPYGAHNAHIDRMLARRGYTEMLWNLSSMDTVTRDPDEMLTSFRAQLDRQERHPRGPGGIILVHDTHNHSVDAFPMMVEELRTRNCDILASGDDEELWDIADDPRIFFQAREGNQNRIARSVVLDAETLAARQAVVRAEALQYCADR